MKDLLIESIVDGLGIILIALIGYISNYIAVKLGELIDDKKIGEDLQNKQYLAKIVVNAIEQIYIEEDGPKKFELAKKSLVDLANANQVNITKDEVDIFIEDAYKAMKDGFNYGKN